LTIGRPLIDLSGQRFGRPAVLARDGSNASGEAIWRSVCDCGRTTFVTGSHLQTGFTTSCGCLRKERATQAFMRHGHARGRGRRTVEHFTWSWMKGRCHNPRNKAFPLYGGRGIKVCDRWLYGDGARSGFECFLADMGRRPGKGYSIERIDNDKGYAPDNCRWATAAEQARNTRRTRLYTLNAQTRCRKDWAAQLRIHPWSLHLRLRRGWTLERLLTTPPSQEPTEQARPAA
jgi:hypothetical protein